MRRLILFALAAPLAAQEPYKRPPQVIVDILDEPPLPGVIVSPDRTAMLLLEVPSMPTIAELAEPMLRLAGFRINPRTNGPREAGAIRGLVLKRLADGREQRVTLPRDPAVSGVSWSPDGKRIAFTHTRDSGLELWVADAATGQARAITDATLNGTAGAPCQWMPSSAQLACRFVPAGRGTAPEAPPVPVGPTIQEAGGGRAAPVRTYQDLLENAHDEALFDHYFTAQLALVDAATGARTPVGQPAVYSRVDPAPNGQYLLAVRTVRPYSYLVPGFLFPQEIEVLDLKGTVVRSIASLPLADNIPIRGVRTGPRSITWQAGAPATLVWAEALDGGDPRNKVEHQDKVMTQAAPFAGAPTELSRLKHRYRDIQWDGAGMALLSEYDRDNRWTRTWIVSADSRGAAPRLLWDRSAEDRYGDPGDPITRVTATGDRVLLKSGDWIYLTGAGASPQGERPFLDRLNLATMKSARLWRADTVYYESVVAVLDDRASLVLSRRESRTEPPNYFVREVRGGRDGRLRALTAFPNPARQLTGVAKRLVTYEREDGIPLSGTLYLPPGYRSGTRLPVVMWAYPQEFTNVAAAGQVSAAPNRFTLPRGPSHLFYLTQGYAVFDDPKMPIVGGDTANNRYVEQLAASARAAVKAVVDLGVADPDRLGVGGHSYGAFMTANLLAHTDLFRAGVARSGAYNRTLTPFGFQNEQRTYWEAPEVYDRMSPFQNATQINEPILLIHGEADNNSGTFPIQSERLYHALKGLGATARYVTLPHESHGYAARESVLHTLAEMIDWMDQHVKNAGPRQAASGNN